jgi:hypothetical protein
VATLDETIGSMTRRRRPQETPAAAGHAPIDPVAFQRAWDGAAAAVESGPEDSPGLAAYHEAEKEAAAIRARII